jgi:hypothetical protein
VAKILEETFASHQKDEEFYIFQIKHYWKLMPHLVMPNFQPITMAFMIGSTLATQASEAREVGKEMEIDFCKVVIEVAIRIV